MIDLIDQYIPKIKTQKSSHLELGNAMIHPYYSGRSVLNLPSSLNKWFNVADLAHPPLDLPELDAIGQGINQVIVLLIDAVSLQRFKTWIIKTDHDFLSRMSEALLFPLTSVVPSTTCAVLSTLWTGQSPSEHGILGYELFLKEYGLIANMITHSPASFEGRSGLLYQTGFNPEEVFTVPTMGTHLSTAGVEAHAFLSRSILGSGLSQMHYASVEKHPFRTVTDLWVQARQLVENKPSSPKFIWIYYGAVDNYSHIYGPDSEHAEIEFVRLLNSMSESFLSNLQPETRKKTLLLILSDHGQIHTPNDPLYDLSNHPTLIDHLHIYPTGENRLAYFYVKPRQVEAVQEYVKRTWPGKFQCIPASLALESGLFGPGTPAQESPSRIGDLIVIGQDDAYLWWSQKPNHLLGRHGGLSEEEMVVPLLAMRLG
jgi:hypothetical protein